jgi:hypothetical protein
MLLPPLLLGEHALVAIYVKIFIDRSLAIVNHLTHTISSHSSMILDIITGSKTLHLVNIYHQVPREGGGHALPHVLSSSLPHHIPTQFMGDLNTHSEFWSLGHSTKSPWADDLVDWFDKQGFDLLNPDGVPTWRSYRDDDSLRPSIIDLALLNTSV